ncbi:hypothetical protein ACLOJK_006606 [Asimina triloba]
MANGYYSSPNYFQPPPLQLCFFLFILLSFVGLHFYLSYEPILEDFFDQLKLILIVSPLLLLLVVHFLSSEERRRLPFLVPLPERDSFHRAGGSPWGVAFLLVFLLFMISYQTSLHERWFPLLTR